VTLKYLLDTNVVSEPLRPNPATKLLRHLRRHEGETAIPSIVWHELQYGCARLPKSRRKTAIQRFLDEVVLASFPILHYGRAAAEWHAVERARLEAAGKTSPFVDGQTRPLRVQTISCSSRPTKRTSVNSRGCGFKAGRRSL